MLSPEMLILIAVSLIEIGLLFPRFVAGVRLISQWNMQIIIVGIHP